MTELQPAEEWAMDLSSFKLQHLQSQNKEFQHLHLLGMIRPLVCSAPLYWEIMVYRIQEFPSIQVPSFFSVKLSPFLFVLLSPEWLLLFYLVMMHRQFIGTVGFAWHVTAVPDILEIKEYKRITWYDPPKMIRLWKVHGTTKVSSLLRQNEVVWVWKMTSPLAPFVNNRS